MPEVFSTIITGNDADPNCLHCQLAKVFVDWMNAHPDQSVSLVAGNLLQSIAEFVVSFESQLESAFPFGVDETILEAMLDKLQCAREATAQFKGSRQ